MNIIVVCSGNSGKISPFVLDQIIGLEKANVKVTVFSIVGNGLLGYLRNRNKLIKTIKEVKPDLIHAHYGFSGLFANLQRKIPVVTTYHGSDINERIYFPFSFVSICLSAINIFVSNELLKKSFQTKSKKAFVQSCGIRFEIYQMIDKKAARETLGFDNTKIYILFSSSFNNVNKNYPLAKSAIDILKSLGYDAVLVEYKGFSREKSNILINAVDCVIVTSKKESGPLIVKEAMAVNTPVVTVPVGDVKLVIKNTEGFFISDYDPNNFAKHIIKAISLKKRPQGRSAVTYLDNDVVVRNIINLYKTIL